MRTQASTADQASEHIFSLAVTHATAMLSRQLMILMQMDKMYLFLH